MGVLIKWLLRLAGALVACAAIAAAGVYYLAARSLPQYDADLVVNGPSAPVQIVRDNANVPHIIGDEDLDVFFALGFAHAQDRLWQMTLLRRTAQGRLSEVFGPATLETDKLMRRFDLAGLAVQSLAVQTVRTRAVLDAYAAGVNARLDQINRQALGRGAPEMFIFAAPVSPWSAADSIAVLKLMGLPALQELVTEVERARVSLALADWQRQSDLHPAIPAGVDYGALFPDAPRFASAPAASGAAGATPHPLSPLAALPAPATSAWAAAPARSAAGGTLLASDPTGRFSAPGLWYLARLGLRNGSAIGATIPGVPAILSGRSGALGWGRAGAPVDDLDLFIERLNPENPAEYLTPGGFRPFRTQRSIIAVKGQEPVTITQRWTDNGPVLRSEMDIALIAPPGTVAALSWTGLSAQDTSIGAAIDLMQAQSLRAAIDSARDHIAPAQTLVLADRDNIAQKSIGLRPIRAASHQTQGTLPAPGWLAENRWQGWHSFDSAPQSIAPDSGILANSGRASGADLGLQTRWQRLMETRQVHTRDSFVEAQLDTVSFTARALLPLIGADLWFTTQTAPAGTRARQRQKALALLANWSGEMNEHMPEPLIYAAWMRALQKRLIEDDLGPVAAQITHLRPALIERAFRGLNGADVWCDIRQSAPKETCTDLAILALDDALIWIEESWGPQLESLRWGDAHQARHDHPVLGNVTALRYFVNIRQSTSGGDNTLMRGQSKGQDPNPFESVQGPGYRGVYDFADPDSSVFIAATGQSGHFLSRHYDDLAQLWRRGEYIPMSLDLDLARAASVGVTVLRPKE